MYVLVRTLGPYYEPWVENIAASKNKEALVEVEAEDRKDLEKQRKDNIWHRELSSMYSIRAAELEEANPYTVPGPPERKPPKCKKPPVTAEEHQARALLKAEAIKAFNKWFDDREVHWEPYRQQARAEIIKAHGLPDDFKVGCVYTPDWMYGEEIEVTYRIEEVREV
jgi:hypothetical protein